MKVEWTQQEDQTWKGTDEEGNAYTAKAGDCVDWVWCKTVDGFAGEGENEWWAYSRALDMRYRQNPPTTTDKRTKVEIILKHVDEERPNVGEEDLLVFSPQFNVSDQVRFMLWNEGDAEDEVYGWDKMDGVTWGLQVTPYWCRVEDIKKVEE